MSKIICLLLGILLISYSLFFIIVYLNIMNMGYSFCEYLIFIVKKLECLLIIPGILFLYYVFKKGKI